MKLQKQIRQQVNTARKRFSNPNVHQNHSTVQVLDALLKPYKDDDYTEDHETDLERFKEQVQLCHRKNLLEDHHLEEDLF